MHRRSRARGGALVTMELAALAALASSASCKPELDGRASLVERARVIAVRADPPEAAPGASVTLSALVAAPDGVRDVTRDSPPLDWAFCASPKPILENDVVASSCLADAVISIGRGAMITATIPGDACRLFGPEAAPGARPRDADETGGWYEPVRATLAGDASIALVRLTCSLANASADAAADFAARHRANRNPTLSIAVPGIVGRGATVAVRASWSADDAEAYVAFDPAGQAVVGRREAMRVSWFITAGALDADVTGRDESDQTTSSDNHWSAPEVPGVVHMWAVLRDARGGVAFASTDIAVN